VNVRGCGTFTAGSDSEAQIADLFLQPLLCSCGLYGLFAASIDNLTGYFICMRLCITYQLTAFHGTAAGFAAVFAAVIQGVNTGHILKTRGLTKHFTVSGLLVRQAAIQSLICKKCKK
jgi:hypothetical protein